MRKLSSLQGLKVTLAQGTLRECDVNMTPTIFVNLCYLSTSSLWEILLCSRQLLQYTRSCFRPVWLSPACSCGEPPHRHTPVGTSSLWCSTVCVLPVSPEGSGENPLPQEREAGGPHRRRCEDGSRGQRLRDRLEDTMLLTLNMKEGGPGPAQHSYCHFLLVISALWLLEGSSPGHSFTGLSQKFTDWPWLPGRISDGQG